MMKKSISGMIALAMILGIFTVMPNEVRAGLFTDLGGPNATFRDVQWHSQDEYAVMVGNDSLGNGVVYSYDSPDGSWNQLASVAGDSYNAVTQTKPFVASDDIESDTNGWTTNVLPNDDPPLVAEWKMDEGAGQWANDTSGNDNDGVLGGGTASFKPNWIDGISGKALEFDGIDDYVNVSDTAGLTNGSFSGMAWINLTTHQDFSGIVSKYNNVGWGIWDKSSGGLRFYRKTDGGASSWQDSSSIGLGEWHHIAWVYNDDSGMAYFYIDGKEDYSAPSVSPSRAITPLTIGKYNNWYLDGKIDEVRIHNYALSLNEISDYYNKTISTVGQWPFDEGTGSLTNDTSQFDNNGTLMPSYPGNVPTWTTNGISGNALDFDGIDDYVVVPDSASLDFGTDSFTIESWVRTDAILTDTVGDIVSKFDQVNKKGFNFNIKNNAGSTGSQSNYRNINFGMDNDHPDTAWVQRAPQFGTETYINAMTVYNGKLYAGTQPNGKLYEWNGVDAWVEKAPQLGGETFISSLAVFNGKLYGGTSPNGKLYEWNRADAWVEVAGALGTGEIIGSLAVYNGTLYGGSSNGGQLYEWNGVNAWISKAPNMGVDRTHALAVYNGKLYGAMGETQGKLFEWNDVDAWVEKAGQPAGEQNIYTLAIFNGKLYGGGDAGKLYEWNGVNAWVEKTPGVASGLVSLATYNGKLYGGIHTTGKLMEWNGVNAWIERAANGGGHMYSLTVFDGKLYSCTSTGTLQEWKTGMVVTYDYELGSGWHHLAAVKDNADTNLKLYVDGELVATSDNFNPADYDLTNTENLLIGFGAQDYFNGYIDEVSIYNYTMPSNVVYDNYNTAWNNYLQNQTRAGDWKFDKGTGATAYDSGIHGNDGTLENMNNLDWVDGISGKALEFDGVDDPGGNVVTLPIKDEFQPPQTLTLSAWVKLNATTSEPIISGGGISYGLWVDGGKPLFRLKVGTLKDLYGNTTLQTGKWYHLAATYDGSVMRIYLNGVQDNILNIAGTIGYAGFSNELALGHYYGTGGVAEGIIDEVQIWQRDLDAGEIAELYYSVLPSNWQQVNPSTLPTPDSGISHRSAHSGDKIWWFGNDISGSYDDGSRVAGSLVTPPKYLSDTSTIGRLLFSHWADVEPGNPGYDIMNVSIKNTTDTGWYQLKGWDSNDPPASSWYKETIDITGWLGNYVQVKFTFDSVDANSNDYAGWHIDDFILYTNDVFVVVGYTSGGYSAYSADAYGTFKDVGGMNLAFNDVAAGSEPASFVAVGNSGVARYWNGSAWNVLTGPAAGETLTGLDFNGTHFFIVGYDSFGRGVAYFITQREFNTGSFALHPISNAPNAKLNGIDWSNKPIMGNGEKGLGLVSADGAVYGLTNPEIWSNANPAIAPSARRLHAMAYDSENKKIVLFGGWNGTSYFGDTWTYDVASNTWANVNNSGPTPRRGSVMSYDSANNKVVLFGGYNGASNFGDTWTYDVASNTWANVNNSGPTPRRVSVMAYDSANNKVVLFGGYDVANNGETWTYDTASNTWTNMTSGIAPSPRYGHAMAYDSANNVVVLFGGYDGAYDGETWTYDTASNTWTNVTTGTAPSPRYGHTMAYDSANNKIVLFGGFNGGYLGDTWTFDIASNTWNNINPPTAPSPRYYHAMAYDPASNKIVLFGGNDGAYLGDTWLGDFSSPWDNAGGVDPATNYTAATWNEAGTRAILVGNQGSSAEVWNFYAGDNYVSEIQDYDGVFSNHQLFGAAYEPGTATSIEVLLVGASAFKIIPSEVDLSTTITVSVDVPHVFDLRMWEKFDPANTSTLNTRVNVEDTYTFRAEVNYTVGGVDQFYADGQNDVRIQLLAWYDDAGASEMNPPAEDTQNRTRMFNVSWSEGLVPAAATSNMSYPSGAPNEFDLQSAGIESIGGDHYYIYFNVTFGPQARAADGGGAFGADVAGTPAMYDTGLAFDDPNSWNFNLTIYDSILSSSTNSSYEEFGVFRFTNVTATGNPAGNAPPGSNGALLSPNSNITYASNDRYYVNVSVEDLVSGPNQILANNLQVQLSSPIGTGPTSEIFVSTYFTAADTPLSVWGNGTTPLAAPMNGTTSHGSWGSDFNAIGLNYGTEVIWVVNVPGATPEGIYTGQITVTVESY